MQYSFHDSNNKAVLKDLISLPFLFEWVEWRVIWEGFVGTIPDADI